MQDPRWDPIFITGGIPPFPPGILGGITRSQPISRLTFYLQCRGAVLYNNPHLIYTLCTWVIYQKGITCKNLGLLLLICNWPCRNLFCYLEPGPPGNVRAYAVNRTSICVEWDPPQKPSGPIITYAVFIPDSVHLVSVMEKVTETVMGRLEPYTNYTVKVRVQNSVGTKESSAVIVQTKH